MGPCNVLVSPTFQPKMTTLEEIVSHLNASQPVSARMRAIFGLKGLGNDASVRALERSLRSDPSALVRHEIAYVLGQMKAKSAIQTLQMTLCDNSEDVMVRHEAGEALGAIGDLSVLPLLHVFSRDLSVAREIRETCAIAAERLSRESESCEQQITTNEPRFSTVDPAFPRNDGADVSQLRMALCDPHNSLYDRYAALFSLRDMGTDEAILALCDGLEKETQSALFRHEVAYVLGQIASPLAIPALSRTLGRQEESYMVRHEAAEALGAIATDDAQEVLQKYVRDSVDVVRESVAVALDIADYVVSDEVNYADTLPVANGQSNLH